MAILDVLGTVSTPTPRSTRRQRHDWVRGEVRCLMCGRLVGRLLGTARRRENGDRSAGQPVAFLAFRPLEPTGAIVPFRPGLRFRCDHCGGAGALDSVDLFSTYDEVAIQEQSDMSDTPRGPGRPRRELDLSRVGPTGLAAALNEV